MGGGLASGVLISFEGIDGVGKSTQIVRLQQWLASVQSCPVLVLREPGGTALGEALRQWLLTGDVKSPVAETLLFAAARAELMASYLGPHLETGGIALLDRFVDSTLAYQGFGLGINRGWLDTLNQGATQNRMPDLTIWIDGAPHEALAGDRVERRGGSYFERVEAGYRQLAREFPERIRRIAGNASVEAVEAAIRHQVGALLHIEA